MFNIIDVFPRVESVFISEINPGDKIAIMYVEEDSEYADLKVVRVESVDITRSQENQSIMSSRGSRFYPGEAKLYRILPEIPTRKGALIKDITLRSGRKYLSGVCQGDGGWYVVGEDCSGPTTEQTLRTFTVVEA